MATRLLSFLKESWRAARARRSVRWLVDLTIVVAVLAAVSSWQTRGHLSADGDAPRLALPSIAGDVVSLEAARGRPVLVVFWAPWCGVCKAQSRNVSWVKRFAGGRAHVISIAAAYEDTAAVLAYVREQGVDYPVLLGDDETVRSFRVGAFPTLYFLDEAGRVERSAVGYTTTLGMLWRLLL